MQTKRSFLLWLFVFVVLNLYVNLVPGLFDQSSIALWGAYWLAFFAFTFLAARYVLRLRGLRSFGMRPHKGWLWYIALGFVVGFGIYAVKYLISCGLGKFEVAGTMDAAFIFVLLVQALLAMFFSSAINEVVIRGYWLAYLREKHLLKWFLPVVTVLYILDDSWKEGFQAENVVFSAILGFTFAYAVLKTGNLWLSIGLHWGGNVMYRMLYGFNGQGVWRLENIAEEPLFGYISLSVTALMFPVVYVILKSRLIRVDALTEVRQEPLSAGTARFT